MTFDTAVSIIRKAYPNRLIWGGFEYQGKFIFAIAVDENFVPGDAALSFVYVDKSTRETGTYRYWKYVYQDDELAKAANNMTLVDVTEDQINHEPY